MVESLKEMGVTMGLVDPMEEKGITHRPITGPTMKAKAYLEVLIIGC